MSASPTSSAPERPDPTRDSIATCFTYIFDKLDALERMRGERRVSASEAARELGYHPKYFHGHPWRYPDYRPNEMHSLTEWKAWLAQPEVERREGWDKLSLKERNKRLALAG